MRKLAFILVPLTLFVLLGAGSCDNKNAQNKVRRNDQRTSARVLGTYQRTQPVPVRPSSQLRQNLIEIESAQMDSTQTTTFFFNQGVAKPVMSCPSIGFPIGATAQLTNPEQKVPGSDAIVPQLETNGIYTGDSTGTYVICVGANGKAFASYWEGFVQTVTGPAVWDEPTAQVKVIGPSSRKFSTSKPPVR